MEGKDVSTGMHVPLLFFFPIAIIFQPYRPK